MYFLIHPATCLRNIPFICVLFGIIFWTIFYYIFWYNLFSIILFSIIFESSFQHNSLKIDKK